ncbi:MAG TPA: DoxX family protein [Gemmatimonadaceae bacterium]|nr:DoxX family protein [Gemmatimonadaceae bacterium]
MRQHTKAGTILLWVATVVVAFGVGAAGITKLLQPQHWQSLFVGWGYPAWLSPMVGVLELAGALALLAPGLAKYAAVLVGTVMATALATLLLHPGGALGWGATPLTYLVVVAAIGVVRWRDRWQRPPSYASPGR